MAYERHMTMTSVFMNFDKNVNSKVDIEELTRGLATAVNVRLTDLEACTLFGHVDKDCSGEVTIDELIEAFRRPRRNRKLPKLAQPRNASSSFGRAKVRAQQGRARLAREEPVGTVSD